jgi:ABC-2 type transport system ATP-binding protein
MTVTSTAIRAEGLVKRYGTVRALDGFDLTVSEGSVCGLLGPNGAGKTTAVRILTTLLRPDGGRAEVAGADVVTAPHEVRRRIGLSGQEPAVDEILSGRQNLVLFGRLSRLGRDTARRRAGELLEMMGLADAGDRAVKHYSGGMRRRLDLAVTLILAPAVLFLDEPTTGLDPRSRSEVWSAIRDLVAGGTTVLLTTQYLDEADQLAGKIVVIDAGRTIAEGSPDELKARVGGDRVEVVVAEPATLDAVAAVAERATGAVPDVDRDADRVSVAVSARAAGLADVVRALDDADIVVADIGLRRPTLDDVFLRLTGRRPGADPEAAAGSRSDGEAEAGGGPAGERPTGTGDGASTAEADSGATTDARPGGAGGAHGRAEVTA